MTLELLSVFLSALSTFEFTLFQLNIREGTLEVGLEIIYLF